MGTQLALPKKGTEPSCRIFGPCPLWPNCWMDHDGTWHRGGPWSRPHCARWGPSSPPQKEGRLPSPILGPFLLWPNGWTHQDTTWYGGRPQPRRLFVRWGPSPPSRKRGRALLPNFWPMSIVAKWLDGSRRHLAQRWALVQAILC